MPYTANQITVDNSARLGRWLGPDDWFYEFREDDEGMLWVLCDGYGASYGPHANILEWATETPRMFHAEIDRIVSRRTCTECLKWVSVKDQREGAMESNPTHRNCNADMRANGDYLLDPRQCSQIRIYEEDSWETGKDPVWCIDAYDVATMCYSEEQWFFDTLELALGRLGEFRKELDIPSHIPVAIEEKA